MENKNTIYGGFGTRFFALIFDDLLIASIPFVLLLLIINGSESNSPTPYLWVAWELFFVQWIIGLLYKVVTYAKYGASLGKILGGLEIVKEDGSPRTYRDGLFRFTVGYLVSGVIWWWGFFWVIKDPKRQGFHDHVAETFVVKKHSSLPLAVAFPILLCIVFLYIYLIFQSLSQKGMLDKAASSWSDFTKMMESHTPTPLPSPILPVDEGKQI